MLPRFHNSRAPTEPQETKGTTESLILLPEEIYKLGHFFYVPTVSFKKENALICEPLQTRQSPETTQAQIALSSSGDNTSYILLVLNLRFYDKFRQIITVDFQSFTSRIRVV